MNFGKSTKADMESRLTDTDRGGDQGAGAGRRGWENGESGMKTCTLTFVK